MFFCHVDGKHTAETIASSGPGDSSSEKENAFLLLALLANESYQQFQIRFVMLNIQYTAGGHVRESNPNFEKRCEFDPQQLEGRGFQQGSEAEGRPLDVAAESPKRFETRSKSRTSLKMDLTDGDRFSLVVGLRPPALPI